MATLIYALIAEPIVKEFLSKRGESFIGDMFIIPKERRYMMSKKEELRKLCIIINFHLTEKQYKKLSEEDKECLARVGRKLGFKECYEDKASKVKKIPIVHADREPVIDAKSS